jgi:hypothetical protein
MTRRGKLLSVLGLVVATLVIAGAAVGLLLHKPRPPAPNFTAPRDQEEAIRQDLSYLRLYADYDRSFTASSRAEFLRDVDALTGRAATLDRAALEIGVAAAAARTGNGHSRLMNLAADLNAVPLRFEWFGADLVVVAAASEQAAFLGARLLAIDGRDLQSLLTALRPFVSGVEARARTYAPSLLQSPQVLHAAGLAASATEITLRLQLADGSVAEPVLAGVASVQRRQYLDPRWIAQEKTPWRHVLQDAASLPLYLQHPEKQYWHTRIDDPAGFYVQINRTRSEGDVPLDIYLARLLNEIRAAKPRHVIVDLRFNSGGDNLLTMDFTRHLSDAVPPDGHIYVITSGRTFSAAIVTVARLKYFGGARVTLVGEKLGDGLIFWSEGKDLVLPNSRLAVHYTDGFHDWEHGCTSPLRCFIVNIPHSVAAGKLPLDLPVSPAYADYAAGRDTIFEAIRRAASQQ